jgi:putative transposase
MTLPQGPNQCWSPDFAADTLTDGGRIRILVVVDDFTRECLCLVALIVGRTGCSRPPL